VAVWNTRIPAATAVEKDTIRRDGPARPLTRAPEAFIDTLQVVTNVPAIGERHGSGRLQAQAILGQMSERRNARQGRFAVDDLRVESGMQDQRPPAFRFGKPHLVPDLDPSLLGVESDLQMVLDQEIRGEYLTRQG
jgi:hypothetical protein